MSDTRDGMTYDDANLHGTFCSDAEKVQRLREEIPRADGLGTLFKALGDETRAKIMYCLCHEELCVCDIARILGMSVQAVSHHLRLLKALRLARSRRDGKLVFYTLDDSHVMGIIRQGLEHLAHTGGR